MNIPPLAIIQCRYGSKRLPGKALLLINGMSLIETVWRRTVEAFGKEHTVIAHPDNAEQYPLVSHIDAMMAERFAWKGDENDVLGRFYACAHQYRWHPDSVIVRVTADDYRKNPAMMRRVANGERLPIELGAEAFTLAMLDDAHLRFATVDRRHEYGWIIPLEREHITDAIFPNSPPPKAPPGIWSIDTQEDYDAVKGPPDFTAEEYTHFA